MRGRHEAAEWPLPTLYELQRTHRGAIGLEDAIDRTCIDALTEHLDGDRQRASTAYGRRHESVHFSAEPEDVVERVLTELHFQGLPDGEVPSAAGDA